MPFVQSGNARIHYDVVGEGTPVLLIMGHLYSSVMWYPLVPELSKTHKVITFDNRGTGQSDTTSGVTVEQMTNDALNVLHAAGEISAHVYGVSMGGGIAGEFAMAYPEATRSVTLGCTLLKTEAGARKGGRAALVYYLPRWLVKWMFRTFAKPEGYGSKAPLEPALRDMKVLAADNFTMKGVREQAKAINDYATTHARAVEKMTMPVLVLHGDEDKAVDVKYGRESGALIPHAKTIIYEGAAHNYLVATGGEGGQANRDFIEFINAVDAGQAKAA